MRKNEAGVGKEEGRGAGSVFIEVFLKSSQLQTEAEAFQCVCEGVGKAV